MSTHFLLRITYSYQLHISRIQLNLGNLSIPFPEIYWNDWLEVRTWPNGNGPPQTAPCRRSVRTVASGVHRRGAALDVNLPSTADPLPSAGNGRGFHKSPRIHWPCRPILISIDRSGSNGYIHGRCCWKGLVVRPDGYSSECNKTEFYYEYIYFTHTVRFKLVLHHSWGIVQVWAHFVLCSPEYRVYNSQRNASITPPNTNHQHVITRTTAAYKQSSVPTSQERFSRCLVSSAFKKVIHSLISYSISLVN